MLSVFSSLWYWWKPLNHAFFFKINPKSDLFLELKILNSNVILNEAKKIGLFGQIYIKVISLWGIIQAFLFSTQFLNSQIYKLKLSQIIVQNAQILCMLRVISYPDYAQSILFCSLKMHGQILHGACLLILIGLNASY